MRRPRTLRARLTAVLALASAIGIVLSAAIGVLVTQHYVDVRTANDLRDSATAVRTAVHDLDGRTLQQRALQTVAAGASTGLVFVSAGSVVARNPSASVSDGELLAAARSGALRSPSALAGDHWAYAIGVHGLTVRTSDGDRAVDTVILVDDTKRQSLVITALLGANSIGAAIGLAALILVVVVLVGRELRPLGAMAEQASALAAGERTARLSPPGSDPLVDRLAESVNTAFDSQHAAEQRVRAFVSDASHELRTPLTVASGWVGLDLQGGLSDPERHQAALERVHMQLLRMGMLIDDLALLARTDEGRALALDDVDLVALANEVVEDLRVVWSDTVIAFTRPTSTAAVVGDAARLAQVIRNLVANAVQHNPDGTIVTVTVVPGAAGAPHRLVVRDDGGGIPPDALPHVFERFWRGDTGRSRLRDGGGTGLGLAIVSSIVSAHGGEIGVTSRAGEGTTFTVQLPATRVGTR